VQKQRLTIPLAGGVATGTDGKQLQIGKSDDMQNLRPGRSGEVTQRNGATPLGTSLIGASGSLPAPWALSTLRGDLVSFSTIGDHPVNVYSPAGNGWATDLPAVAFPTSALNSRRRGPISTALTQISGNGLQSDAVYAAGYYWVIYKTTRNGAAAVVATAIEASTGQSVGEKTYFGTFVSYGVRVVNGSAVFVYATTAIISIETWSTSTPSAGPINRVNAIKTVANAARQFDMMVKDGTTISAAYSDGTNIQCFDYAPTAGAATFWTPNDSAAAAIPTDYAIAWMQDTGFGGSGKQSLVTLSVAQGLRVQWDIPSAGATRQAASTYVMDAAAHQGTIAGFTMTSAATGQFTVLYDQGLAGIITPVVLKAATREAGVIATATYYRSVALDSKPFIGADGKYYVGTSYVSPIQPTRYVLRVPETITNFSLLTGTVAKMQLNNGYVTGVLGGPLCPVSNPSSGDYAYSNTVQLRLPGNPTTYVPQGVGIDVVHVLFKALPDTTTGAPREAIDSLFTPGGTVGQFDGRTYCEAGFAYYPEQPAITPAGGGSLTAAATYYYALVYRWIDNNGRTWRSKPSPITSQAMGANTKNTLACPTLRLADRDDIAIEIYRGGANDNVTLALAGTVVNDPTVDSVNFVDTFADTTVAAGERLYTNGAVGNAPLGADGIPGSPVVAIGAGRAWIISNDNPYEVWPSNKFIPGQGWRFSESNKLILNDSLGPAIAVGFLPSGTAVIFKATAYYLVSGDGPNQAGNGGSFSVSQPVIGAGTTNPRSILETPSGIEFQMPSAPARQWYRVNTAQNLEYIGSPIERYAVIPGTPNLLPIVGTAFVSSTGETRYFTSTSNTGDVKTLVHDTITDTWMVDTSPFNAGAQNAACAYAKGAAVAVGSTVYVDETTLSGFDGGNQFVVVDTTPWIKGADLDGYAMFVRARGVGESPIAGPNVTVGLQADFDPTVYLALESASPGVAWDWEIKYTAKPSSFRFVVSYTANNVPVKLSAIVVEYGVKSGLAPATWTKRTQ
jgi:hypothetical protein